MKARKRHARWWAKVHDRWYRFSYDPATEVLVIRHRHQRTPKGVTMDDLVDLSEGQLKLF